MVSRMQTQEAKVKQSGMHDVKSQRGTRVLCDGEKAPTSLAAGLLLENERGAIDLSNDFEPGSPKSKSGVSCEGNGLKVCRGLRAKTDY